MPKLHFLFKDIYFPKPNSTNWNDMKTDHNDGCSKFCLSCEKTVNLFRVAILFAIPFLGITNAAQSQNDSNDITHTLEFQKPLLFSSDTILNVSKPITHIWGEINAEWNQTKINGHALDVHIFINGTRKASTLATYGTFKFNEEILIKDSDEIVIKINLPRRLKRSRGFRNFKEKVTINENGKIDIRLNHRHIGSFHLLPTMQRSKGCPRFR